MHRQSEMCEDEISCLDEADSGHAHQTDRTYQVRGAGLLFCFCLKIVTLHTCSVLFKSEKQCIKSFSFDFDLSFKESSREVKFVVDIRKKFP